MQNYFERQTWTVKAAPADFEAQLRSSKLAVPVVVVPKDFEAAILHGDAPVVEFVNDSANKQSAAAVPRVLQLLKGSTPPTRADHESTANLLRSRPGPS